MDKIKTLVISQQPLFLEGIFEALAMTDDIEVTTAEITDAALAKIVDAQPHIALIDVDSSPEDSLKLVRRMKQCLPEVRLIMMSSNREDSLLMQNLKGQTSACIDNNDITAERLVGTVRSVAYGEQQANESFTLRQKVALQVLHRFHELAVTNEDEDDTSPLTSRETEILSYVAKGFLNKQIATELGISEQTIKNHVTSILRKLNASARTEAVVVAIRQGLITIS